MFNNTQNKGHCDNNPVHSNYIHWKLIFNEVIEEIILGKTSLISNSLRYIHYYSLGINHNGR